MDLHSQMILEEYESSLESYKIIKDIAVAQLKGFVDSFKMVVNSIEARVKTKPSLTGKLELKGYKYKTIYDITDIVGARVVTFYADEVDIIASKVTSTFDIDWENSIDKRKIYKIDQFGYMSLHYICSIPESLYKDEKHPEINKIKFEIQIRSVLQHCWATIYHDTGYKNDVEVPKEYLRQLNRLAGILEMADESFKNIRTSLNDYRRRIKSIVDSGDFNEVELTGDAYHHYISSGALNDLTKKIASINNMEVEEVSLRNYLPIFKTFGFQTLKDLDDFVKNNAEYAYRLAIYQFKDTDIDIITSATPIQNLCFVHVMQCGYGEGGLSMLLTSIFGERKSNASYAKKLYSYGKNMGIVKEEE